MYLVTMTDLCSFFIEHGHRSDCLFHGSFRCLSDTVCITHQTDSEFLGKDQYIRWSALVICIDLFWIYNTHHRQSVFDIGIGNGMTSCQRSARLDHFFCPALHDLSENI